MIETPEIIDDDVGTIRAMFGGVSIRTWAYADRETQRWKMRMAREFVEGWFQCARQGNE